MASSSLTELVTSRAMAVVRGRLDARFCAVDKVRHAVEVFVSKTWPIWPMRFVGGFFTDCDVVFGVS